METLRIRAKSGCERMQQIALLLDHLVGAGDNRTLP
jgi:hypothetical protein